MDLKIKEENSLIFFNKKFSREREILKAFNKMKIFHYSVWSKFLDSKCLELLKDAFRN